MVKLVRSMLLVSCYFAEVYEKNSIHLMLHHAVETGVRIVTWYNILWYKYISSS